MSGAVALIYIVHDLSRGNVASVSDPLCAAPACHTALPRLLFLLLLFLPPPQMSRSFSSSFSLSFRAQEFSGESRFLIYDRSLRRADRKRGDAGGGKGGGGRGKERGGGGNETERVEAGRSSRCRLFRVTFDGRLVTRLNLRRIEYIALTRDTYVTHLARLSRREEEEEESASEREREKEREEMRSKKARS